MTRQSRNATLALVAACLMTAGAAQAQQEVPNTPLTYRGKIVESDGTPVTGVVQITFGIFKDNRAVNQLCEQVFQNVTLGDDGAFMLAIDSAACREKIQQAQPGLYVKISASGADTAIGGSSQEIARHRIATGAYSVRSAAGGGAVGDIEMSFLNETEFQVVHGANWVLADGRDVSGSVYATLVGSGTLPDLRGMFLRGKQFDRATGGNPAGDKAAGTVEQDALAAHSHTVADAAGDPAGTGSNATPAGTDNTKEVQAGQTSSDGAAESRPRNMTVNYFIRIN